MTYIEVDVNEYIQVAHRLTKLPGKCQQIHGHSMSVAAFFGGMQNRDGYIADEDGRSLDFGELKDLFRVYLKAQFDHHLLLNVNDPLKALDLPGAVYFPGDPCVENLAKWIFEHLKDDLDLPLVRIVIDETTTNGVSYAGI